MDQKMTLSEANNNLSTPVKIYAQEKKVTRDLVPFNDQINPIRGKKPNSLKKK